VLVSFVGSVLAPLAPWQLALLGTAAFLFVLAGFGTWSNQRSPTATLPYNGVVPPPPKREDRIFVGSAITYAYLTSLYKDKTEFHAAVSAQPFIGKWMRVSGRVTHVGAWDYEFMSVGIKTDEQEEITLFFDDEKWIAPLSVLGFGDHIVVDGEISQIGPATLTLYNCELVAT
jgi:hypothetical protein